MALKLKLDTLDGLDDAIKALYVAKDGKFELSVDGIEDTGGLKTALQKEREARAKLEGSLKAFDGVDPAQYKNLMDQLNGSEEMRLMAEGKYTEVLDRRTAKFQEELTKKLTEEQNKTNLAVERSKKFESRVLEGQLSSAATQAGVHKHAIDDVLARGRSIFTLDDAGNAIQLGADGKPVLGKDAKTLFSPAEWLGGIKETAPHWFPNGNTGSPANDGGSGGGSGKTMKRDAFMKLSPEQQRQTTLVDKIVIVD